MKKIVKRTGVNKPSTVDCSDTNRIVSVFKKANIKIRLQLTQKNILSWVQDSDFTFTPSSQTSFVDEPKENVVYISPELYVSVFKKPASRKAAYKRRVWTTIYTDMDSAVHSVYKKLLTDIEFQEALGIQNQPFGKKEIEDFCAYMVKQNQIKSSTLIGNKSPST
jgi:hypothetical protein